MDTETTTPTSDIYVLDDPSGTKLTILRTSTNEFTADLVRDVLDAWNGLSDADQAALQNVFDVAAAVPAEPAEPAETGVDTNE